jgi:1-deoxy-D-xylulose-5-phosphate reductoisomerase
MEIRGISVLGSTGSIGTQTLDVCGHLGFNVTALAAGKNISLIESQARRFKPALVSVADEVSAKDLSVRLGDTSTRVTYGEQGLIDCAAIDSASHVVTAVVGIMGLKPTLAAITAKKTIALANKETLVCAGRIVMEHARANGVSILPVDSEHSAIFQCLQAVKNKHEVKKLWLTASGGALYGYTREQLETVTPEIALKHPNWSMGAKVTIDSATLFNKGLECIEACHLFDVPVDKLGVVIHRQSIVHSMVELIDGAVLTQCGEPDMRLPIQYALTFPNRDVCSVKPLDFTALQTWTFEPPSKIFESLDLALEAARCGDAACCALNAADEVAVARFLSGEIGFLEIPRIIERGLIIAEGYKNILTVEDVLELDAEVRQRL